MRRGIKALITVMIVFSMLSIILLAVKFNIMMQNQQATAKLKHDCLVWEDHIIAQQSSENSATVAFQAADFNAKCGDVVGAGNELTVSSN